MNAFKNIAILQDNLNEAYGNTCWQVVVNEFRKLDMNVFCYPGGALFSSMYHHIHRNTIFDLIDPARLDGIITVSGGLCNYTTPEKLQGFLKRFDPVPIVSIGVELPGIPSILVDNFKGMYDLVSHFIEAHGYKRIAFIAGPPDVMDARIRLGAYKKALEDHRLPVVPELILPGDFTRERGQEAGLYLLEHRNLKVDAVIGANDYCALYAMKEFLNRGIKVPGEIAFGGFDDIRENLSFTPSLSTVEQPIWELALKAVECLKSILAGKEVPGKIVLPTRAVIRESCGCPGGNAGFQLSEGGLKKKPVNVDRAAEGIIKEFRKAHTFQLTGFTDSGRLSLLVHALLEQLEDPPSGAFFSLLKEGVLVSLDSGAGIKLVYTFIDRLFREVESFIESEQKKILDQLIRRTFVFLGVLSENRFAFHYEKLREQDMIFNLDSLTAAFNLEALRKLMLREFARMGLKSVYLSFYEEGTRRKSARLFAYYDFFEEHTVFYDEAFPSSMLIPGGIEPRKQGRSYMIFPLFFREEVYGFGVYEIGEIRDGIIFEKIMKQLGGAIKTCNLVREIRNYGENQEKMVETRTRQLRAAQKELIASAHEAGMADVAINVIHNVGNILNSMNSSLRTVEKNLASPVLSKMEKANALFEVLSASPEKLKEKGAAGNLLEYYSLLLDSLKEERLKIREAMTAARSHSRRIEQFIRRHEAYTKNTPVLEPLELNGALKTFINNNNNLQTHSGVTLKKEFPSNKPLHISGSPYKLFSILDQLTANALEAMADTPSPQITFGTGEDETGRFIFVKDTGCGIAEEHLNEIFQFGFTTKPDHMGFSLHSCANFMVEMKGRLKAVSQGPGKGATFYLFWNKEEKQES